MSSQDNVIIVNGQRIPIVITEIGIFDLTFWSENPRIDSIIKQSFPQGNANDKDIENCLWKLESVKELFQDIKQNDGLIDEILVKGNVVLEGNSRLCAYRYLYDKASDDDKSKWSKIRAKVIPDNIDNEIIFTILGTWHIKGKASWKTFEKASYIYRLHHSFNISIKDISNMVKQGEPEVRNMIETYKIMQQKNITETSEQKKFSAIFEIVKNREMKKIKETDPKIYDMCLEAVKNDKFERAEQVRDLPKIINDKIAKKVFFEQDEDFGSALDVAKSRHPEHEDSFYNQIRKITTVLKSCPVKKIEEIKQDNKKKYIIKELYTEAQKLYKKIEK